MIKESGRSGSTCENESRQELTWKHKKIKGKKNMKRYIEQGMERLRN